MTSRKALLGLAAASLLLGGCGTPYYGPHYAYGESGYSNERPLPDANSPVPPAYSAPPTYSAPPVYSYPAPYYPYSPYPYYAYPYYGPSVSFGFAFGGRGYGHHH